jgi:hypothetical protein
LNLSPSGVSRTFDTAAVLADHKEVVMFDVWNGLNVDGQAIIVVLVASPFIVWVAYALDRWIDQERK